MKGKIMELKKEDIVTVIDGSHKDRCPLGVIDQYSADECQVSILGGEKGIIYVKTKFLILIARNCKLHPSKKLPDNLLKAIQNLAIKCHDFEAEASKSYNHLVAKEELPHIV